MSDRILHANYILYVYSNRFETEHEEHRYEALMSRGLWNLLPESDDEEAKKLKEKHHITVVIFSSLSKLKLAETFSSTAQIILYHKDHPKGWSIIGAHYSRDEDDLLAFLKSPALCPKIALIAHNNTKDDLVKFCRHYQDLFSKIPLITTQTTGQRLIDAEIITRKNVVMHSESGPVGGDAEVIAAITKGGVGVVIFFKDHLTAHPHQPDIIALDRNCDTWQISLATNVSTATDVMERIKREGWKKYVKKKKGLPSQVQKQKANQKTNVLDPSNPVHKQKAKKKFSKRFI